MSSYLDNLADVSPCKEKIKIRVGIIHMWKVTSVRRFKETVTSIEVVFVDQNGFKMQATVPEELIPTFEIKLIKCGVYLMSDFSIVQNLGSYRVTVHSHRLIFRDTTDVIYFGAILNPSRIVSLLDSADICDHQHDCDYLSDVIGLLTGASRPKEYNREGQITRLIFLELSDARGKFRCILSGDCIDSFQSQMIMNLKNEKPIIVIEYAKIRMLLGYPTIENVKNITRIYVNPLVQQSLELKKRLVDVDISLPVKLMGPKMKNFKEVDFLLIYPKKTIFELNTMTEDGIFVIFATIIGPVEGEKWWYPGLSARKINKDSYPLVNKSEDSADVIFHLIRRFRVKFDVCDRTDQSVFVLFDDDVEDLVGKNCDEIANTLKGKNHENSSNDFQLLCGMNLLFLVEKESSSNPTLDGSYKVRKVCSNPDIIDVFNAKDPTLDYNNFPKNGCACGRTGKMKKN